MYLIGRYRLWIGDSMEYQIRIERYEKGTRCEMTGEQWLLAVVAGPDESTVIHMFGSIVSQVLRDEPPRLMSAEERLGAINSFANAVLGRR